MIGAWDMVSLVAHAAQNSLTSYHLCCPSLILHLSKQLLKVLFSFKAGNWDLAVCLALKRL